MIELFKDIKVDWLGKRKLFLAISGSVMLLGLIYIAFLYFSALLGNGII